MPYQLEFSEERVLHDLWGRELSRHRGAEVELRRAYDAIVELGIAGGGAAQGQTLEECRRLYTRAFERYRKGLLHDAELQARAVEHLCRAAWWDAKLARLVGPIDDLPRVPGLIADPIRGYEMAIAEIESRLSRLKLTGLADRFGARARAHLQALLDLPEQNSLVADTHAKAAFEYCLATEALHDGLREAVA